jgi:hypothetical protein
MIAKRPSVLAFPQSLPIFFCLQAFPFVVVVGLAAEMSRGWCVEARGEFDSFLLPYISLKRPTRLTFLRSHASDVLDNIYYYSLFTSRRMRRLWERNFDRVQRMPKRWSSLDVLLLG